MPEQVAGGVVDVIELVGSSDKSFSDAVRNAVRVASETIRHIVGVEVLGSTADVGEGGELTAYKVNVKVAFLLEETMGGAAGGEDVGGGQSPGVDAG